MTFLGTFGLKMLASGKDIKWNSNSEIANEAKSNDKFTYE